MNEEKLKILKELCRFIKNKNGQETILFKLKENSIFEFVIVTTASSEGHLHGLFKSIIEYFIENGIDYRASKRQDLFEEKWICIDCYYFILNIMVKEVREFYDIIIDIDPTALE